MGVGVYRTLPLSPTLPVEVFASQGPCWGGGSRGTQRKASQEHRHWQEGRGLLGVGRWGAVNQDPDQLLLQKGKDGHQRNKKEISKFHVVIWENQILFCGMAL